MSLFMQSPSANALRRPQRASHLEQAQMAVTYEIYAGPIAATRHTEAMAKAALSTRRATSPAMHTTAGLRPDGSGFIVKNRYPPRAKHG